ncbi:hypothetical protein BR93DRAFT_394553 [Coniochaeta sp. PMI_546]|nr:hypothetical protein BR93DRAFT_394553 [Coniochaeta sp. PMI_546]
MASSKEMQQSSRPLAHRPSLSVNPSSGSLSSSRQSHSRTSSHSVLSTSLNASHRVTRRKSMTNPSANVAAVAAALTEAGDMAMPLPIAVGSRRNTMSKYGNARSGLLGSLPSPPASLPTHKFVMGADGTVNHIQDSAIDDDQNDRSADEAERAFQKARIRRASDGQPLVKEGRKSNRPELRCEKCGKGYKHSSCLTKHLWEHTPEWSVTSKLLISKHQQVQLLEAASVLLAMNNEVKDSTTPPDSAKDFASDQESASPAASGFSDVHDRSSADTTPPPAPEPQAIGQGRPYRSMSKRLSSGSGFGRSYQSAPFTAGSFTGSTPVSSGFGHFRQQSQDQRPTSSGKNTTGKDDRELAAAVELLSCSLGSNAGSSRAVHLPADAPPVPPLPAQYLDQAVLTGTSFINSFPRRAPESFTRSTRSEMHRDDVKMEGSGESAADDEDDVMSRARSDEDDEGVFGRMEE